MNPDNTMNPDDTMKPEKTIVLIDDHSKNGYLHNFIRTNRPSLDNIVLVYIGLDKWNEYSALPAIDSNDIYLPFLPASAPSTEAQLYKYGNRIVDMLLVKNWVTPSRPAVFLLINFGGYFLCRILKERLNACLISYIDTFAYELQPSIALQPDMQQQHPTRLTTDTEKKMLGAVDTAICHTPETGEFIRTRYHVPPEKITVWEYDQMRSLLPSSAALSPKLLSAETLVFLYISPEESALLPALIRLILPMMDGNPLFRIAVFCDAASLAIQKDFDAPTISRLIPIGHLEGQHLLDFIHSSDIAIIYSGKEVKNNIPLTAATLRLTVLATPRAFPASMQNAFPDNIRTIPFCSDPAALSRETLPKEWVHTRLSGARNSLAPIREKPCLTSGKLTQFQQLIKPPILF